MRRFGAVDGGMDDDVTDVETLVGGLGSEAQKIVGELLPAARVEPRRTGEAREKRRAQDSGLECGQSRQKIIRTTRLKAITR